MRNNLRKKYYILEMLFVVSAFTLTACGSKETVGGVKESDNVAVEETIVEETSIEVAKTVVMEEVIEEEIVTYESPLKWAMGKSDEPTLTIWNSNSKEGIILSNGQEYEVKEGDILVLCGEFGQKIGDRLHFDINGIELESRYGTSIHHEFDFVDISAAEYLLELDVYVNEELKQQFSLKIIGQNTSDSTMQTENILSGKDWAQTLAFDETKLLIWNDNTGKQEIIDVGSECQLDIGDRLAIYHGKSYMPFTTEPSGFCEGFIVGSSFSEMEYSTPKEPQTINLNVELFNLETSEFVVTKFIIKTP